MLTTCEPQKACRCANKLCRPFMQKVEPARSERESCGYVATHGLGRLVRRRLAEPCPADGFPDGSSLKPILFAAPFIVLHVCCRGRCSLLAAAVTDGERAHCDLVSVALVGRVGRQRTANMTIAPGGHHLRPLSRASQPTLARPSQVISEHKLAARATSRPICCCLLLLS
jgi:hypothetical protein